MLLIILEYLVQWDVKSPFWKFILGITAFAIPILATFWAIWSWHCASLTKKSDGKFREFIHSCVRDSRYDEAVRILMRNKSTLAKVLTKPTFDLVFDQRFVQAMMRSQTWLHIELLADASLLEAIPNYHSALDRTIRELLVAEESPLRKSAVMHEGGDETAYFKESDIELLDQTFHNARWYHNCRAGYPLVIAAWERISSGRLDESYNRADVLYGASQGITPRSRCTIYIAIKTIAHALRVAIKQDDSTVQETHIDSAYLWDIFKAILDRSVYKKETWDEPSGYGDHPTPYGYLLAEILSDYRHICEEGLRACEYGVRHPPNSLGPVIHMWAHCVLWMSKEKDHVSPRFCKDSALALLEMVIERRQFEINATDNKESAVAWTRLFVGSTVDAMKMKGELPPI